MCLRKTPAFAFLMLTMLTAIALAVPIRPERGEPARTQVLIKVSDKVNSFKAHQLDVVLLEHDPRAPMTEPTRIDRHSSKIFSHKPGTETILQLTLAADKIVNPGMNYTVTVEAFDAAGKRTHIGDKDGKRGLGLVLTDGKLGQATLILREARPHDIVMDIADEIKKGNDARAAKIAQATVKEFEEISDIMHLYRPRSKGGLGWGSTPGNNQAFDGIEAQLRVLVKKPPVNFAQEATSIEEASYGIAALAELTAAKASEFARPRGKKNQADWHIRAVRLRIAADDLGRAVAAKNVQAIQQSAQNITNACTDCHLVYRE